MNPFRDDKEYDTYHTLDLPDALRDLAHTMKLPEIGRGVAKAGKAIGRGLVRSGRWIKDRMKSPSRIGKVVSDYFADDDMEAANKYSTTNTEMEPKTIEDRIARVRQYMYSHGQFEELRGFNAAVKMFAAANTQPAKKSSFKETLKRHKGKILGAAALALAAGAGAYGVNKKRKADEATTQYQAQLVKNATSQLDNMTAIAKLTKQLEDARKEYAAASASDAKTKADLESQIKTLKGSIAQLRRGAQVAHASANKKEVERSSQARKNNTDLLNPTWTTPGVGGGKGTLG